MTTIFEVIDSAAAEYFCKHQEYNKGLEIYRSIIKSHEGNEKLQATNDFIKYAFEYASLLAQENKWGEAINIYKEIMHFPDFPVTTYKNVGLCLKAMNKPDEALSLLEMYRERTPNNAEVLTLITW